MTDQSPREVGMTQMLKPCPFCGAPAELVVLGKGQANERHGVRCADLTCGAMVRLGTKQGESAELWNTRVSSTLREALEPFAKAYEDEGDGPWHEDGHNLWEHPAALDLTVGDLRRARAAIETLRASSIPEPEAAPMLTEAEQDELVERINANPMLHPLPPEAASSDEDAEWVRQFVEAQKFTLGERAKERLEAIANRLSAEPEAVTLRVEAAWNEVRDRLNAEHEAGIISYRELKAGLNNAAMLRVAAALINVSSRVMAK